MLRAALVTMTLLALGCGDVAAPGATPTFEGAPAATLDSASGRLTVNAWTWPAPLAKGVGAVRFQIVAGADAAGTPVDGAALSATLWMPAHGHGTSVRPAVTPVGGGAYDVEPLALYMAGRWELRATLVDASGAEDSFVAAFDVR